MEKNSDNKRVDSYPSQGGKNKSIRMSKAFYILGILSMFVIPIAIIVVI
jgi:hypothetical protein